MSGTRTAFGVMAVLAIVLAVAGLAVQSKKKPPPKSFLEGGSFRAVVVPDDRPRTVVVTPCDAPSPKTGEGARSTPGVIALRVGGAGGRRTVLVPRCTAA